jgi:hypothetical protein
MGIEIERFASPTSARETRALEGRRRRAGAALAGRTVWCVSADATAARTTRRIRACVERLGGGSPVAIRIDHGEGAADTERARGALAGVEPRPADVVVLCDPRTAELTPVVRDYGSHTVWAFRSPVTEHLELLVARYRSAVDAYLDGAFAPLGRGAVGERVTARVPAAHLAASKVIEPDTAPMGPALALGSALAEVVGRDRRECVGGVLHARPTVAVG